MADFAAALRAFKMPDEADFVWKNTPEKLVPLFECWLGAVSSWVHHVSDLVTRVGTRLTPEAIEGLNASVKAAVQRQTDEYAASLVQKLDSRSLKKLQKAMEREKAKLEAEENAPK